MSESTGNAAAADIVAGRRTSHGTVHRDAVSILIHEATLQEVLDCSEQDTQRELGGFLTGGVYESQSQRVEVRHFVPAVDARSKITSLTFTHDTWAAMTREVDLRYPDDIVVGWQHTHPGFGVFLSGYDLFIHRHFFNEPWQIALVVDPRRRELGFFQWRDGQVTDCGFTCLKSEH